MKYTSLFLAVLLVLSALGGCKCDNSDYYSTPDVTPSAPVTEHISSLEEISAPEIGSGEYTMLCTFLQNSRYADEGGVVMDTEWDMKSWYDFTAEKTEDGLRIKFTIARRSYTYSESGKETVIYDTADESTKYDDSEIFFDIIGHSFTVDFDKDYKIKSVGGTKKLYSEVEGASTLLGESEIRAIAEELLLSLPETVTKDTVISHSQTVDRETDMEMNYGVSKISESIISFKMTPVSKYGLPEAETGEDYSIEYTGAEEYTGTLDIMSSDRLLQSSRNRIIYYSVMKLRTEDGTYAFDGMTTVTDSCEVTLKP